MLIFSLPMWVDHKRYWGFEPIYRVFGLLTAFIPILILSNSPNASYLFIDEQVIEGGYELLGFILAGLTIWLGVRKHWNDVMNTGTVFFVIYLYTKMFDWWWELMPRYLFFMIMGITAILFLVLFKRLRQHAASTAGEARA